jgi:hypothetical protein
MQRRRARNNSRLEEWKNSRRGIRAKKRLDSIFQRRKSASISPSLHICRITSTTAPKKNYFSSKKFFFLVFGGKAYRDRSDGHGRRRVRRRRRPGRRRYAPGREDIPGRARSHRGFHPLNEKDGFEWGRRSLGTVASATHPLSSPISPFVVVVVIVFSGRQQELVEKRTERLSQRLSTDLSRW